MDGGLAADYEAAGFSRSMALGSSPALVVVDVQRGYVLPDSPLVGDFTGVIARICDAIDVFRERAWPVCFTQVVYARDLSNLGVFGQKVPMLSMFRAGEQPTALVRELQPISAEPVFEKQNPSAFFGTTLHEWLLVAGVDTLVVAGLTTSGCVRATVVDGMSHGFMTVALSDGVGDRRPEPHEAALFDIQAKYGEVLLLDELVSLYSS